ncbi:class I SAM-dependent methyltransferase [Ruegeria sp. 2205SS24-7]|uniref:class I SAM-dependent methyltransferase n=1 Tax=Ruegeria discodermiae TaxID=3064389 RepID=UPI0027428968|nr:class I SAM-dependent methyltransferase [Ruegeria sp. 2205SS24-7]MDP5218695.1 class I SAM-dependent methyltransferase [Ruegeria sp. 2205SS24-7]
MKEDVFSSDINKYGFFWKEKYLSRMNNRAKRIFSFDHDALKGGQVLDLGARFGFWSWAAQQLGAAETLGIEGRQESAARGGKLLAGKNHRYIIGNAFDVMPQLIAEKQSFDVILNLGFFYHIYDHYGMLKLMDALSPKVIVIDSEIDDLDEPVIRVRKEKTWEPNNAIAEVEGQQFSAVGTPSRGAIESIADCFDYNVKWCDWSDVGAAPGCDDYRARRRFTCLLTKTDP